MVAPRRLFPKAAQCSHHRISNLSGELVRRKARHSTPADMTPAHFSNMQQTDLDVGLSPIT